ncbi:hypothetical protein QYS49_33910 [Marivirga salinae]|uniref:T9SS C-terminal target domain-containing protein n=1 Tax=Marivirga salinarum TaxID=3059078 RepID=A0AA51NEA7_9BACT|nr:hypothetical protein [Marivirga sp. BDSF4-3]WMN12551.1 hypothetical protein QYS49_33910 [Marivirga sp. BDSF4-3]
MKKINLLAMLVLVLAFGFTACDENTVEPEVNEEEENEGIVVVTDNITENTTWSKDKVYQLGGRIVVEAGAELTIEAGTIIKGEAGSQANATALIVARDGKLFAQGTADEPIIFTSVADEIQPGEIASPNLDPTQNGLWGGVIILGNAPISASAAEVQIEGIPTSDPNGLYGGTNAEDNSGEIRYISIRHGGTNIGAGNEINGLTLGGVGSGTVIENVEIVGNQDDGIEWFGGTVNVTNALVWNAGDDGMDTDQSWSGTMDNFLVVTPAGHCFELDGPEGDVLLDVQHVFSNGTVVASSFDSDGEVERGSQDLINTDNNSGVILRNVFITGIADGQIINRVNAANVTFDNVILDVNTELTNYIPEGSEVPAGIVAGTSGQADASVFANWTWADVAANVSSL